jgi:hypothetical protein
MCKPAPIGIVIHYVAQYIKRAVAWEVSAVEKFERLGKLPRDVRVRIGALSVLPSEFGPHLGRPRVDTLKGSKFKNMKELRFGAADGERRVAFAFDPWQTAVLLLAADKSGVSQRQFYARFLRRADERFAGHLVELKGAR